MPRPWLLRLPLVLGVVLGVLFIPARAEAQTVSVSTNSPGRPNTTRRANEQLPDWINQDDCVKDAVLTFDTVLTGDFSGVNFEVWASASDCSALEKRQGGSPTCWLVFRAQPTDRTFSVPIKVRDIVGQLKPPSTPNGPGAAGADVCESTAGRLAVTLTFMFIDASDQVLGTAGSFSLTGFDVTPPPPPTDTSLKSGENRLHLSWEPATASDVEGYRFYCDPPPGAVLDAGLAIATVRQLQVAEGGLDGALDGAGAGGSPAPDGGLGAGGSVGAGDAATGGVASTDGGTAVAPATCSGTALVPGTVPDPAYECGGVTGRNASSGTARGLANGEEYGVAIAAVDEVGNVGKLSDVKCKVPVIVTDFYEYYRELGGEGGGGFCTVSRRTGDAGTALTAVGGVLLGAAVRRRRRRP